MQYITPPWLAPLPIVIKPLKKKTKLAYKNWIKAFSLSKTIFVYTNKCKINKKVDALVTAKYITRNSFIDLIDLFKVYSGELYNIWLGTRLTNHVEYRSSKIFIYVNN